MFTPTPRFSSTLSSFASAHALDPAGESSSYHSSLDAYVRKFSGPEGPSEALLLAANCQHIRRWERPRKDWPEGLSGYKTWRTNLNKFHADVAEETMLANGYDKSNEEDAALIARVRDLLLKKTLGRPPFSEPLRDPEMHLFENAICLVFLSLQFTDFAQQYISPEAEGEGEEKLVGIVRKTWAKMTDDGRKVVAEELVGGLSDRLKEVVGKALADEK